MTAAQLFEAALAKVESKSIREWATSVDRAVIYIVSNAIGLW